MVMKFSADRLYKIRDPQNFNRDIRKDVELLRSNKAYVSLTTIIMCCIDALAAETGWANREKFKAYVDQNFAGLCRELEVACANPDGAGILYENFRNGFAHLRGPKTRFVIAEDHELQGRWADKIEVEGSGELVAINVDRLTTEFLRLL
jgi:hypothetical protein